MNNNRVVMGILAHVDAGKTTLSESMLYQSGSIRSLGRVDHKNTFLDTHELERRRGITIFSKQAVLRLGDRTVTLLDTPGHVDFSAEMERTLQVLDYAVLVINGADGVQGHTTTLWNLLKRYEIPVFLFINKMDQEGTDKGRLLEELAERLDTGCLDFGCMPGDGMRTDVPSNEKQEQFLEQLAMSDERVLERYLEEGTVDQSDIIRLIRERKIFPCYFGSALRQNGVKELLDGLKQYAEAPGYPDEFAAKVFKISRDNQGTRLTHMKITGGILKVKDVIGGKINQIRIYSGDRYEAVSEAAAGDVCAVAGPENTYAGQALGAEAASRAPMLEPVLSYQIILPPEADIHKSLKNLRLLEEEDPQLHIVWNERLSEIHVQVMGEVQIEILKSLMRERFDLEAEFGAGNIVYKETIRRPVEGIGHFEPLRHYAEVHLLLEPGERGSGLVFETRLSEDLLDGNWQRLILTHLKEREHPGVLTGAPITDMKITLIAGQAHKKHTEGGDFRQSTYRAVRQGLKKAENILLEPYYAYRLVIPPESVGRAMADMQKMSGSFEPPQQEGEFSVLTGYVPVAEMRDYQREFAAYTKGRGRMSCRVKGYEPCHNAEEVIASAGYDSERDPDNPTGSVFCTHGAGFTVSWDKVEQYMHVESGWKPEADEREKKEGRAQEAPGYDARKYGQDEKELERIFERTYGPVKRKPAPQARRVNAAFEERQYQPDKKKKQDEDKYLLVDGYNIIFAWEELKELADLNIMSARDKLMDILSDYQGFCGMTLILVFDAYKVAGNPGTVFEYHNIHVVYTKEAETADQYIEKTVHKLGRKHHVTVATSDALEQVIILGQGGQRLSAEGLREEITLAKNELRNEYIAKKQSGRSYLFDNLSGDTAEAVELLRNSEE